MTTLPVTDRLRIDAPDAGSAMRLERRLADLGPTAVSVGEAWWVEIPALDEERLGEVVAVVERWLEVESLDETTLHVDGTTRRIVRGGGAR